MEIAERAGAIGMLKTTAASGRRINVSNAAAVLIPSGLSRCVGYQGSCGSLMRIEDGLGARERFDGSSSAVFGSAGGMMGDV